ncbi:MAG: DUF6430 domain-containing protein [Magnetococcus sp. THC-1_WYH]
MRKINEFFNGLFKAIGVIGSVITTVWAIFPQLACHREMCNWSVFFVCLFLVLFYASYTIFPKKKIVIKLSERVTATVFSGDIFESEGILVIPVNDYFDIEVDDKIVSSETLHGKFVCKYFAGNGLNLREQINKGLSGYKFESKPERETGNKKCYPLGTVCEVKKDNLTFYLVAFTRSNSDNRAEIKNSEYQKVLCDLFYFVEKNSQGKKISIPLIGAGHSGVNLSKQKLLEFLLFSIALKDNLTLINGVNIVLHESNIGDIDLSSIEVLFRSLRR